MWCAGLCFAAVLMLHAVSVESISCVVCEATTKCKEDTTTTCSDDWCMTISETDQYTGVVTTTKGCKSSIVKPYWSGGCYKESGGHTRVCTCPSELCNKDSSPPAVTAAAVVGAAAGGTGNQDGFGNNGGAIKPTLFMGIIAVCLLALTA